MTPVRVHLDRRDHAKAQRYYDDQGIAVVFEHHEDLRWGIDKYEAPGQKFDRYEELRR